MKRIYLAGAYSADNVLDILHNMRKGIRTAASLVKAGYAVYCPWLDYQLSFFEDISVKQYYDYSMAWLEVADEVWVLPDWENSKGTKREIKRARELDIPVKYL
jgi:hypothetical protein